MIRSKCWTHETINLKNSSCPSCEEIETIGLSYLLLASSLTKAETMKSWLLWMSLSACSNAFWLAMRWDVEVVKWYAALMSCCPVVFVMPVNALSPIPTALKRSISLARSVKTITCLKCLRARRQAQEVLINLWRIQETCEESVFQSVSCNVVFKRHFMSLLNCFIQQSIDKIRLLKATQIKYSYLKNKQLLFIQFDRK